MKIGVLATIIFGALVGYPIASFAGLAPDADGDGVPDVLDKCMLDSRNTGLAACDTDQDGYGNVCDGDFNQNGSTNTQDFSMYFAPALSSGVPTARGTDMNCNGSVNTQDFSMHFAPKLSSGAGGGPSGLACAGTIPCN